MRKYSSSVLANVNYDIIFAFIYYKVIELFWICYFDLLFSETGLKWIQLGSSEK